MWIFVGLLAAALVVGIVAVRSKSRRVLRSNLASQSPDQWKSARDVADDADVRRSLIHPTDTFGGVDT